MICPYSHIITFIDTFPIIAFAPEQLHINDLELLSNVLCIEFRRASFPCSQKHMIFMIFGSKAPGPMVQGPWGPWDPAWGLGKATYSQTKLPTVRHAPNNRIHAPSRAIDTHPKAAYMQPKVSIDLHPTTAYFAPNRSIDLHPTSAYFAPKRSIDMPPKGIDVAAKSSRIHAPKMLVF